MSSYQLLIKLLKKLKVGPRFIFLPLALALGAALLEGVSTGLLIPLLHGLVEADFSFLWESSFGEWCTDLYPFLLDLGNIELFILVLAFVFIASCLRILLSFFSDVTSSYRMREIEHRMRNHIVSSLLSYGKGFFDRNRQGELYNITVGFTQLLCLRLQRVHIQIRWFMVLGIYGALMLYISWELTLVTIAMLPFYHYPVKWVSGKIGVSSRKHAEADSFISSTLHNILSCMPLIKVSAMEDEERKRFSEKSQIAANHGYNIDRKVYLISPIHETLSLVLIMILTSCIAFLVLQSGVKDISSYLVFLYLLKRASTAFGTIADLTGMFASIHGYLIEIDRICDPENKSIVPNGSEEFTGLKDQIAISDLSFSYGPEKEILHGVDLTLKKGEITALVGPSGGGKSTISSLLLRFYDSEPGRITVDDYDLRDLELSSFLDKVSFVSQDTYLFNDTFENNITYGLKAVPLKKQIEQAISAARLETLVESLPEGLETNIGDRGVQLSGGEKQRLSIARAILRDPEILILDEATSALDADTEHLVQEALDELVTGKTVLVIAHRFSTLRNADKIYVIENGIVSESGSFDDLVKKEGTFYGLWKAQDIFY